MPIFAVIMNIEEIREYCLSLPLATEDCPFGPDAVTYRVGGKIFCLMELSGRWSFYNLKCEPSHAVELCEAHGCIRPGFHMNKKHWISVDYRNDLPPEIERGLIAESHRLAAATLSRRRRVELGLDSEGNNLINL